MLVQHEAQPFSRHGQTAEALGIHAGKGGAPLRLAGVHVQQIEPDFPAVLPGQQRAILRPDRRAPGAQVVALLIRVHQRRFRFPPQTQHRFVLLRQQTEALFHGHHGAHDPALNFLRVKGKGLRRAARGVHALQSQRFPLVRFLKPGAPQRFSVVRPGGVLGLQRALHLAPRHRQPNHPLPVQRIDPVRGRPQAADVILRLIKNALAPG